MRRNAIAGTDLEVSVLCLGTMTFGTPVGEQAGIQIVQRALDLGVNFIDTANMYEGYTRYVGSPGGAAELILGKALAGRRGQAVIATKVGMKVGPDAADEGLSPAHVRRECERSLRRLGVEQIDLYYMHRPDPQTPLPESLGAFAELIRAGKVRHWGLSNFDADQVRQVLEACDVNGWPRPVAHQPPYSLLKRQIEADLLPLCRREGIAVVPYQVLQGGLLSGKYRAAQPPPADSRGAAKPAWLPQLEDAQTMAAVARLTAEAAALGMGLLEHSLRQTAAVPGITSLILGVTQPEQLAAAARALE